MKIGLIGYGKFAKLREECLRSSDVLDVEVVGYFDPYSQDKNLEKFPDVSSLLKNVDALIISVPPSLAPKYVQLALEAGKNVFCEKPAAINIKNLNQIDEDLLQNNILAYGLNHRVHSSIIKMKQVIDGKKLGSILWMRGRYGKEVDDDYSGTWRCNKELNGGGILIDQGIHMVDLMAYLAGGFDGANAVLSTNYLNLPGVEDNGFITLFSTSKKISASIHTTVTQWRYIFSLEIFMEKGSIILNGLRTKSGNYGDEILSIKPNSQNEKSIVFSEERFSENMSWQKEIDAFLRSCATGTTYPYAGFRDAQETTQLIDLIYREAIWL
jgi:predicted dehydrogenase